ncbi:winged helix DNA-binding domain-containing protein [Rhodococcus sp. SGAir0479]|uniref:winged helix DNA-binding domain-containing protein n=1 Tax=Rhodococcus sp. SGAir0479 TaxID=2567884 RepID=UPI0010CD1BBA|nr:winged helix DNA-binding domain-containing protein [Rhodococcus sp. SGAir0479]QCQ91434.1 winged helix DNA-binding domain-containing protein [Rhodococcus sp. SGAir0479]
MTTVRELARLRLVAQRVAGPPSPSAVDTVRWLTAAQAQDFPGALTSVALRSGPDGRASILDALNSGAVVRSWPMRGTLHFVAAEDLPWMLALSGARTVSSAAARHRGLGIDDAAVTHAREVALAALDGTALDRPELMRAWEEAGIETGQQRGPHLLWTLALTGVVCLGPVREGRQRVVRIDQWIERPRVLDIDAALAEWALRYFRSHGPATLDDFVWWTKLPVRQARTALEAAAPDLEHLSVGGRDYFLDPAVPALLEQHQRSARGVFLLPGFDEFILGYRDRTAAVAAEFECLLHPGNNGMFKPTVVDNGRVVGTWRRADRGATRNIDATPFTTFTERTAKSVPRVYAALP